MTIARPLAALLATLLLAVGAARAGEPGTVLKADELKAEPFRDARTLGSLTAGDKVEILGKQGGWFQVSSARGKGWVRMLSIRRGEARKGVGDAAEVFGLASGRAGSGRVVATTGIRGLDEEQLKAAKFDAAELKKAESFATTRAQARTFAADGRLMPRKVEYLPAPETVK
jgi:hypothetical protein